MSRARRRCDEMSRILALRVLSTRLAENGALEEKRALHIAGEEREAAQEDLIAAIGDWDRALTFPRFDPLTVAAWGAIVNQQAVSVAERDATVKQHREALAEAERGYHHASAEERCAQDLWRKSQTRLERQREEQALALRDDEITRAAFGR